MQNRPNSAVERDLTTQKRLTRAHRINLLVDMLDSIGFAAWFMLKMSEEGSNAYQRYGRYVIMPLTILWASCRVALAWYQAKIERYKAHSTIKATVETIAAGVVSTTVIGGFAAEKLFSRISPYSFSGALLFKTLYNLISGLFNKGKSSAPGINFQDKSRYLSRAKGHTIGSVLLALSTVGVFLVMALQGDFSLPGNIIGLVGTTASVLYCSYKLCTTKTAEIRAGYDPVPTSRGDTSSNEDEIDDASLANDQRHVIDMSTGDIDASIDHSTALTQNQELLLSDSPYQSTAAISIATGHIANTQQPLPIANNSSEAPIGKPQHENTGFIERYQAALRPTLQQPSQDNQTMQQQIIRRLPPARNKSSL